MRTSATTNAMVALWIVTNAVWVVWGAKAILNGKGPTAAGAGAKVVHYENVQQFYGASSGGRVFQWVKDQLRPTPDGKPASDSVRTTQSTPQSNDVGHADSVTH